MDFSARKASDFSASEDVPAKKFSNASSHASFFSSSSSSSSIRSPRRQAFRCVTFATRVKMTFWKKRDFSFKTKTHPTTCVVRFTNALRFVAAAEGRTEVDHADDGELWSASRARKGSLFSERGASRRRQRRRQRRRRRNERDSLGVLYLFSHASAPRGDEQGVANGLSARRGGRQQQQQQQQQQR